MKKVDLLLIYPQIRSWDYPRQFPTGIGIIASVVRNAGYSVAVIDAHGERHKCFGDILPRLVEYEPRVVGIGGLITTYGYVKKLVPILQGMFPSDFVVVGNGHGAIPEIMTKIVGVDCVVCGEADFIMPPVVELVLFELRDYIRDVIKSDETIMNLDCIPFPAWDLFPMEEYLKHAIVGPQGCRDHSIITSRGCPYQCTYCYQIFGRKFRQRSVGNVLEEIKTVRDRYGVDFISFQDDCFIVNRKWVVEFCEAMLEQKIGIEWACCGRVNLAEEELYRTMRDAGCRSISYGIESGSQRILDILRKEVRIDQAKRAIELNRKVGLRCPTSFMLGSPGETRDTAMETVRFCNEVGIHLQSLMFTTPYPDTPLWDWAIENGKIGKSLKEQEEYVLKLGDATNLVVNLTDMFDGELIMLRDEMIEATGGTLAKKEVDADKRHFGEHGFNE